MIGSGNVATHLSIALSQHNFTIESIFSPHLDHAMSLAKKIGNIAFTNNLCSLPKADCYIFSVKDEFLSSTIEEAKRVIPHLSQALCIHTAGSISLSVFNDIENAAVLYPMQSFSKDKPLDFSLVPLFIEATNVATSERVEKMAHVLSTNVTFLNSTQRKKLHLAAVFANNFTNHCCALAYKLLEHNGIDPSCLLSIIDETAHKLHTMSPIEAQTGPAARWDENVMQIQRELLADLPQLQHIYDTMSQSIHQLQHTTSK